MSIEDTKVEITGHNGCDKESVANSPSRAYGYVDGFGQEVFIITDGGGDNAWAVSLVTGETVTDGDAIFTPLPADTTIKLTVNQGL